MNENKTNINWFPGHMAKTKRQINEQLNLVDIVYEVIDARMPISSKIVDIDELLANKPKILVVTKYDLCDKKETDIILDWYKNNGYYVAALDLMNGKLESLINFTGGNWEAFVHIGQFSSYISKSGDSSVKSRFALQKLSTVPTSRQ